MCSISNQIFLGVFRPKNTLWKIAFANSEEELDNWEVNKTAKAKCAHETDGEIAYFLSPGLPNIKRIKKAHTCYGITGWLWMKEG